MGLSKCGYRYLLWDYKQLSIVTLLTTLITKSHDPLSMDVNPEAIEPCTLGLAEPLKRRYGPLTQEKSERRL